MEKPKTSFTSLKYPIPFSLCPNCSSIPMIHIVESDTPSLVQLKCHCTNPPSERIMTIKNYLSLFHSNLNNNQEQIKCQNEIDNEDDTTSICNNEAYRYCIQCNKWLCQSCLEEHDEFEEVVNNHITTPTKININLVCEKHNNSFHVLASVSSKSQGIKNGQIEDTKLASFQQFVKHTLENKHEGDILSYEFTPFINYGINELNGYKISGQLNLSKLNSNTFTLQYWKYLYADNITIIWTMEAFPLFGKSVDYVKFEFYNMLDSGTNVLTPQYTYTIPKKISFNGTKGFFKVINSDNNNGVSLIANSFSGTHMMYLNGGSFIL